MYREDSNHVPDFLERTEVLAQRVGMREVLSDRAQYTLMVSSGFMVKHLYH